MQKPPHATFRGQVKRGQDNWKKGRVQFYVEVESGFWTVQLYHEVNPDRVVHRYKSLLGKSANIVFKCNRLIIGDKRDGELHIKIPDYEASNAQKLVKKIMSYNVSTPTHNRAEVGLNTSLNRLSGSKEKLNVTPTGLSTLPRNDGWLSKKTPPPMQQDRHLHSSAKRKIQLDHASSPRTNGNVGSSAGQSILCNGDSFTIDEDEEDEEVTFPGFTGMKDYSKSQRSSNNVNIAKGFGTTNFYGAQNSLMTENAYRNLNLKPTSSGAKSHLTSPSQQNGLRSPKVKRPKLSDLEDADRENKVVVKSSSKALIKGALANRMTAKVPSLSDPQGEEACAGVANESAVSQDTSGHLGDGHTVGFDNLGNTCFMNSPLQCLSSLEPLSLDIQSAVCQFGRQLPPNSITKMLYLLMKDVRKLDVRAERVREILTRLRHDINGKFEYNTQQDAHELLAELLDRTDEEVKALLNKIGGKAESSSKLLPSTSHLNSPPSDSGTCTRKDDEAAAASQAGKPVSEEILRSTPTEANFTWFYKTSFFFHECKTEVVSSQDERDTTLMLALDSKTINLQDCIDKYFESSEVDMRCEKCGKEEKATMTRKIVKRPRCFILNLLRYHTHNLEAKKKLDRVTIPRFMSVVEFCAEDVKAAPAIEPVFMLDRVPYETSPGLPVGSANEEIGPDLAVEAARCGRQVAMAMSVVEEKRKQEAEEHDSKATEDTGSDKDVALNFASNRARPDGSSEKRNSVNEQEQRNDWEDIDRATVKRLANHLADQFAEVEQHIEMARQAEEDFTEIYSGAQSIILNTSEMVRTLLTRQLEDGESTDSDNFKTNEQLTLCLALMQRSLTGERSLDDEFDFYKVIRKLIALRYRSVSGHAAQMNHLVNDLAMYLAAKDVGVVVDPDSPKPANLPVPTVETNANTMAKENKVSDCCPESEQARTKEEDGFGGEGQDGCTSHEDVFMEEDSGNRGSLEVNTSRTVHNGSSSLGEGESESWSTEGMSGKQTSLYIQSIRGRRKSSGEDDSDKVQKRRKDNEPEEESSGALADVSHSATINTTKNNNSLCDAGFLSDSVDKSSFTEDPLLLERPISTWSEQDLQKVDIDGLNEEDMMVYAQALSRFEYEREQINYTVSTSARTAYQDPYFLEDIIDSCDDSTAISYDEISANGRDSSGQRENKDGPKNTDKLDDSSKIPGEVSSTSGSSLSETSDVEREAENISKIKDSDGASNGKTKNGVESSEKIPELLCEETLSDSDEPDGMADDQNAKRVKGLKGGQSAYSSSSSCSCSRRLNGEGASVEEPLHASDGKPCQSCKGQAHQCSETSAKVLSPCKGLRNHSNTLPPLDKSSSSSSGSVERNVRSRQSSTRSPRHRPLSPGASPLSSPTSSVTGHQKSSFARDIQMRSPSASQSSPRKETYSLSQTKSAKNDLARLRSPSTASPRKRPCKDSSAFGAKSAVVSVSKCLSFEDENTSSLKGSQNSVKQLLASEDGAKSLSSNSILDNYPMQEDLINGSLAKSENGEEADPDGINGILSLSNTNRCDNSSPLFPSLLKSNSKESEDQTTSLTSSYTGSIPIPVPVSGSLHNSTNNMKLDASSNASASPKEEVNAVKAATAKVFREAVADLSSLDAKENLWKRDESEEASDTRVVSARSQLSPNEEKENLIDSLARKERLENIEMGKADSSYRLVGIVNHHGESLFAGHYTAFSFNFNKQRWFFMDDKHTRQTVEATARAESANSGYVFFYMDKDIFDKYALNVSERPPKGGSTNS